MLRKLIILVSLGIFFLAFLAAGPFLHQTAANLFFLGCLVSTAFFSWHLLPSRGRDGEENRRWRFRGAILASLLVLSYGGLALNFYLLPGMFHPLSLLGDLGLLLFAVFLFRRLTQQFNIRKLATGLILFALFIGGLSIFSPGGTGIRHTGIDLLALPYLPTARPSAALERDGVTVYDPARAGSGYNLYVPWIRQEAYLIT